MTAHVSVERVELIGRCFASFVLAAETARKRALCKEVWKGPD